MGQEAHAVAGVKWQNHPWPAIEHQIHTAFSDHRPQRSELMLIEEVVHRENMKTAYSRVLRNRGAPGVDGMSVDELMPFCREHWDRIREELLNGTYVPMPVRRVEIPKPGGKGTRTLGIPTVLDRMIQQAILQILSPVFDPTFSDASYGFRPRRSAHDAVRRARAYIKEGRRWVVDLDLEKFFDRVNHDILMSRVARRIKDKQVLRLIRRYLQAGMMDGGVVSLRSEGTPQGGPLSPLLSNILLHELDAELEKRGQGFVRYADDVNVYVRSEAAGHRVLASLERFLWKRLRLRINREKSAVDRPWKRQFLGYSVTTNLEPRLRVSPKAIKRLKSYLRPLLRAGRGRRLQAVIAGLAPKLRGWIAYFRLAVVKANLIEVDAWIRRKLRCIAWRQWKTPRTRFNRLRRHGVNPDRAARAAWNGRGPWWNAGASHMHLVVQTGRLRELGLISLLEERDRLVHLA